jgi:hypothetical protein
MASINLRKVPAELRSRLKSEAALAGVGLEEHCLRLLGGEGRVEPEERKEEAPKESVVAVYRSGFTRQGSMIYERKVEAHDPAMCRTYKCGMCAAMKEKA